LKGFSYDPVLHLGHYLLIIIRYRTSLQHTVDDVYAASSGFGATL
jgi:hypothetical protein